MPRRSFFSFAANLSLFALLACRSAPAPAPIPDAARPPVKVAVAGCARIRRTTEVICETKGPLRIVADGALDLPDGGADHVYEVEPTPPRLRLSAGGAMVVDLAVAPMTALPWLDDAKRRRAQGDLAGADAIVGDAGAADRAQQLGQLGRNALARGDIDRASACLDESVRLHEANGEVSDAVDDAFALAYALSERSQEYTRARASIERVRALLPLYPEGQARERYYGGVIASETGDLRAALAMFAAASESAARFGMARLAHDARLAHAITLARLGRTAEADAVAASLTTDDTGCGRVDLESNLAFMLLERSEPRLDEALAHAEAAKAQRCEDPALRATALGNLAAILLRRGEVAKAENALSEMERLGTKRLVDRVFALELAGRVALAKKDRVAAARLFDEECALARPFGASEEEWRCQLGRGEAAKTPADAIAAYRLAEDALDRSSRNAPLGAGRTSFAADRETSHRLLVTALVAAGRADEALRESGRPLARSMQALVRSERRERMSADERARLERAVAAYRRARTEIESASADDWKLDAAALAAKTRARQRRIEDAHRLLDEAIAVPAWAPAEGLTPPRDALALGLFRGEKGPIFLARHGGETRTAPEGVDLAAWLASLDDWMRGATRVLVWSELETDLHAPKPVEYVRGWGPRTADVQGRTALVLSDPASNLRYAKEEAAAVATALRGRGFDLLTDAKTPSDVLASFGKAHLFHYAGHALFSASDDGLETALALSSGRLVVGDVLAAPRVPAVVVLSACEAAKRNAATLGMADAFIAAGSAYVLAPTRVVDDARGAALITRLYASWPTDGGADGLAEALRKATDDDAFGYRVLSSGW